MPVTTRWSASFSYGHRIAEARLPQSRSFYSIVEQAQTVTPASLETQTRRSLAVKAAQLPRKSAAPPICSQQRIHAQPSGEQNTEATPSTNPATASSILRCSRETATFRTKGTRPPGLAASVEGWESPDEPYGPVANCSIYWWQARPTNCAPNSATPLR
jgi:hypothetical protein